MREYVVRGDACERGVMQSRQSCRVFPYTTLFRSKIGCRNIFEYMDLLSLWVSKKTGSLVGACIELRILRFSAPSRGLARTLEGSDHGAAPLSACRVEQRMV